MKRLLFTVFIVGIINLPAVYADEENNSEEKTFYYARDDKGLLLSAGAYPGFFSAGLGIYFEESYDGMFVIGGGEMYGVMVEYKSEKELHIRAFNNYFGRSGSGFYFGGSAIAAVDFSEAIVTGGLAPETGIRTPYFSLGFRYNFYIYKSKQYNCPELLLQLFIARYTKEYK